MAWLSRVNFIASDTLSFSDINNLGNDIRAWGGNVNGGGYVLSNVVLSASAGTMATVTGGTGAASTLTIQSTSGAGTSDAIIFKTASQSEKMRILSNGRVGINTSAPANIFTVLDSGSLNTGGDTIDVGATVVGPNYAFGIGGNAANFNVHSNSTLGADVGATIGMGGRYTGTSFAQFAIIKGAKENATDGNYATYLAFGTRANGGSIAERMRINSAGNVGIGTTSPSWQTQVYGTGQNTALLTDAGSKSGSLFVGSSNGTTGAGGALLLGGITAIGVPTSQWAIKSLITSTTANGTADLAFSTRAATSDTTLTERVRILVNGNVGIGTTSPGVKLQVAGASSTAIIRINSTDTSPADLQFTTTQGSVGIGMGIYSGTGFTNNLQFNAASFHFMTGNVGIGTTNPSSYTLQLNTDSAGKPGVGGLWTVVSDERIKTDITPADLDRCYEIVKSVPLKHFGFAPGVYTDDQIKDKHSLGWIAQDVQKVFSKAVSVKPFTLNTEIPDGTEEYTEQDFTMETVEKTETSIQIIDGKPVQVSKVVTSENKVLLFDSVDVVDEAGAVVMDNDKPLTYQMPRMVTKTRNKVRHDVIEDCLDLNGGQMIAALYGAVQALMLQVESLKAGN